MYEQTRRDLDTYADSAYEVATGTDDGPTGWADVDAKMGALRRRLREAEDADDFKAVGLQCVSVLEALGRAVFNPERHLPDGEEVPHPNDAQTRLGFFLKSVTKGKRFEEVRPIIRSSWRQAQAVKHRNDPNRTDAGIAADAIALLTAITRRLADEESESTLPKSDAIPF
jgi:hypothetical protein